MIIPGLKPDDLLRGGAHQLLPVGLCVQYSGAFDFFQVDIQATVLVAKLSLFLFQILNLVTVHDATDARGDNETCDERRGGAHAGDSGPLTSHMDIGLAHDSRIVYTFRPEKNVVIRK